MTRPSCAMMIAQKSSLFEAMATAIVGELATSHDVAAVMTSPAAIHP